MLKKRLVIILLSVLSMSIIGILSHNVRPVSGITWVEGHITYDTTWSVVDSPYVLINDVIVDENVTLTIQPGAEVKFGGDFFLRVEGSLQAVGNNTNRIVFTSNALEPKTSDWKTIEFTGDQLILHYCDVFYADRGITSIGTETTNTDRLISIEYCVFSYTTSGIYIIQKNILPYPDLQNLTIMYNTIEYCSNGIEFGDLHTMFHPSFRDLRIENNTIRFNSDGLEFNYSPELHNVTFQNNRIYSNVIGIHLGRGYSTISNSHFIGNSISSNEYGVWGAFEEGGNAGGMTFINNSVSYNRFGFTAGGHCFLKLYYNDIYQNEFGLNHTMWDRDGLYSNATYNYWGASSGPYHPTLNPLGEGDPVSSNGKSVLFIPFLASPIGEINQRPEAVLEVDEPQPYFNVTVTFDASKSTDDGRVDYYFFDFGDGTNSSWIPLSVVTHKYTQEGIYIATLIVMDDFGVTSLDSGVVYVTIAVIPEFLSLILLPLFMLGTLLAAMVYRRKGPKPAHPDSAG